MKDILATKLEALTTMPSADLSAHWSKETGRPVPKVSTKMLRLALAWEIQAKALGGHSRASRQKLAQLAATNTRTSPALPGMRLMREWNGTMHVVHVGDDGVIRWHEREWRSLSEVARAITGTRWSGPAFFGLKTKAKAA